MTSRKIPALLLSQLLLAGCAPSLMRTGVTADQTLTLRPEIAPGGLRAVASTVAPYTKADIDHLLVRLYTVSGDSETPLTRNSAVVEVDVASGSLSQTLAFKNLHSNTAYRARAFAYRQPGTATGDLISDGTSYVDIPVGTDTQLAPRNLPVKLMDRLFSGQGTASIVVYPGGLQSGAPSMSVVGASPAPSPTPDSPAAYAIAPAAGHPDPSGIPAGQWAFVPEEGMAKDSQGYVYFSSTNLKQIYKVSPGGALYLVAGNGLTGTGGEGVVATQAPLLSTDYLAVDASDNVFIYETNNSIFRIRFIPKVSGTYFGQAMTAGSIYTVVGSGQALVNGPTWQKDRLGTESTFGIMREMKTDADGNLFMALSNTPCQIAMLARQDGTLFGKSVQAGYVYSLVGTGVEQSSPDGTDIANCPLVSPNGLGIDGYGNVLFTEWSVFEGQSTVRIIPRTSGNYYGKAMVANKINSLRTNLTFPVSLSVNAAGNYIVPQTSIRFSPASAGTFFGQVLAQNSSTAVAGNGSATPTPSQDGVSATTSPLGTTASLLDDANNIFVGDSNNNRLHMVPQTSGSYFGRVMTANNLYTIAGNGTARLNGEGYPVATTALHLPRSVAIDPSENLYIVESGNHRLTFVPSADGTYFGRSMTAGNFYTLAGTGTGTFSGEGGPAKNAALNGTYFVTLDSQQNIYLSDTNNHRVRMIPRTDGTYFGVSMTANNIYTIAGDGTNTTAANNDVAPTATSVRSPQGLAFDGNGNLYISDVGNYRIRMIPKTTGTYFGQSMTANKIYTIAGSGASTYSTDGVDATTTGLRCHGLAVDAAGNVFFADNNNNRVRMVASTTANVYGTPRTVGYIYTVAGSGTGTYDGDGALGTTKALRPQGLVFDNYGNLLIADNQNYRIRMLAGTTGSAYGQSVTAGHLYTIAGTGTSGLAGSGVAAVGAMIANPVHPGYSKASGRLYIPDQNSRIWKLY